MIEMYKIQSDEVQLPKLEAWIEKNQKFILAKASIVIPDTTVWIRFIN